MFTDLKVKTHKSVVKNMAQNRTQCETVTDCDK